MWKYLVKKEFKQFLRDPGMPGMVLMFPFLIILVFPFATNMEIRNVRLVMVDNDHSDRSHLLMEKCASSGWFEVLDVNAAPESAQALMDRGRTDAILTIDNGFSQYLEDTRGGGGSVPVGIKVNTVNGTRGSIAGQYLNTCVTGFISANMVSSSAAAMPGFDVSGSYRFNPYLDYKLYMIPGLIVIAITMMCGFLPALNIVSEKEKGTIEQINVTPVKKTTFIACKMVPYVAVAYFMVFTCLLLAYLVFGYSCRGSYFAIIVYTLAHILVMASFGLLVSNFSENTQQAMFVIWFFSMIFMLMSGVFTPIESMPQWAKTITYANPLRYFADAMRAIFLKGCGIRETWPDLACLLGIGSLTMTWAVLSYKKTA